MCGIAGFVGTGTVDVLHRMTGALAHRGPDSGDFFIDSNNAVHLGHRRLAIIDIAGGHQPMWNEDDTVGIIFNGEIYNHETLRAELVARGHKFRSDHSDTEVLVHGYEEWGSELPLKLNGMFAFAIYDKRRRRLFLARDRFGEKPLFYSHGSGFFGFASELNALHLHPVLDRSIDERALQKYFAYGYLPAPHSIYEGSAKLPGGHHLTYDIGADTVSIRPYWQFRITPDESLTAEREDALVEELRHLLVQAVQRRLISDVPLGVFLSGGLDSSTAVMGAVKARDPKSVKTFNIGFQDPSFDESSFARTVAEHFGTDHREQTLDLDLAIDVTSGVLNRLDEPLADPSIVPTYLLSRFTRQHVTVALSGDGGDELFAGYDPFKALAPAALYSKLVPRGLHRGVRRLADLLPVSHGNMSFDFKVKRALLGLSYPPSAWTPAWMSLIEPDAMGDVFEKPVRFEELYDDAIALWNRPGAGNHVDRTLEFFTNFYLQDDILTKVDRAAMMVSLESRAIFLDNDLVDFCARLPSHFKYRNGQGKYLLRKALTGLLPEHIVNRRKKGFGIPLVRWLPSLQPERSVAVPGMRASTVEKYWGDQRGLARDHRLFLWGWLVLQAIMRRNGEAAISQN